MTRRIIRFGLLVPRWITSYNYYQMQKQCRVRARTRCSKIPGPPNRKTRLSGSKNLVQFYLFHPESAFLAFPSYRLLFSMIFTTYILADARRFNGTYLRPRVWFVTPRTVINRLPEFLHRGRKLRTIIVNSARKMNSRWSPASTISLPRTLVIRTFRSWMDWLVSLLRYHFVRSVVYREWNHSTFYTVDSFLPSFLTGLQFHSGRAR